MPRQANRQRMQNLEILLSWDFSTVLQVLHLNTVEMPIIRLCNLFSITIVNGNVRYYNIVVIVVVIATTIVIIGICIIIFPAIY